MMVYSLGTHHQYLSLCFRRSLIQALGKTSEGLTNASEWTYMIESNLTRTRVLSYSHRRDVVCTQHQRASCMSRRKGQRRRIFQLPRRGDRLPRDSFLVRSLKWLFPCPNLSFWEAWEGLVHTASEDVKSASGDFWVTEVGTKANQDWGSVPVDFFVVI